MMKTLEDRELEEFFFGNDGCGHWYIVPVAEHYYWTKWIDEDCPEGEFAEKASPWMISGPISQFSFWR